MKENKTYAFGQTLWSTICLKNFKNELELDMYFGVLNKKTAWPKNLFSYTMIWHEVHMIMKFEALKQFCFDQECHERFFK